MAPACLPTSRLPLLLFTTLAFVTSVPSNPSRRVPLEFATARVTIPQTYPAYKAGSRAYAPVQLLLLRGHPHLRRLHPLLRGVTRGPGKVVVEEAGKFPNFEHHFVTISDLVSCVQV